MMIVTVQDSVPADPDYLSATASGLCAKAHSLNDFSIGMPGSSGQTNSSQPATLTHDYSMDTVIAEPTQGEGDNDQAYRTSVTTLGVRSCSLKFSSI